MGLRDKRISASDEYWHTQAELFSGAYSTRELLLRPNQLFLRQRMEVVARFIKPDASAVALDAGCGSGELATILSKYYKAVVGVDYSQIMIDLARGNAPPPNVEYRQADCAHLPMADDSIDYVFSLGLLDYLPDLDAVLQEFSRVSKDGARMVLTVPKTPSLFEPMRWSSAIRGKLFKIPPLVNVLSRQALESALARHGLQILDITSLWTTMWIVHVRAAK
jgi:ubiquinone/menaquinone biosynthesis C-methylase UbiE